MTDSGNHELILENKIVGHNEHDGSMPAIAIIYVTIFIGISLLYGLWESGAPMDWTWIAQAFVVILVIIAGALLRIRQLTVYQYFFLDRENNQLIVKVNYRNDKQREWIFDLAELRRVRQKKHHGSTALFLKFGIKGDDLWITRISRKNVARIKIALRKHIGDDEWKNIDFEEVLKKDFDKSTRSLEPRLDESRRHEEHEEIFNAETQRNGDI